METNIILGYLCGSFVFSTIYLLYLRYFDKQTRDKWPFALFIGFLFIFEKAVN